MKSVIKKWYRRLGFPAVWDEAFDDLLQNSELPSCTVDEYADDEDCGKRLLMFLYFCEDLQKKYANKGIEEKYLIDTLKDIVVWAKTHYAVHGCIGLSETSWLRRHLTMQLIKLGRLQFCMASAEHDIPDGRISEGENVLEVHICEGEKLDCDDCLKSFAEAKWFFAKYFPEFSYRYFTCHSWLLDETLYQFLGENSNIIKFRSLFEIVRKEESYAILKYIFRWDVTKENLTDAVPKSSFAEKVKKYVLSGGVFYEALGIIEK